MWIVVAAFLGALLIGSTIVGLAGWSLWRSIRRLWRVAGDVGRRAGAAAEQLSNLTDGPAGNPGRAPARTMGW